MCVCVAFRCTSAVSQCLFTSSLQSDVLASRYKCKSVKIWIVQRIRLSDSKFKYKEVGLLSRGTYTNKIVLLEYIIFFVLKMIFYKNYFGSLYLHRLFLSGYIITLLYRVTYVLPSSRLTKLWTNLNSKQYVQTAQFLRSHCRNWYKTVVISSVYFKFCIILFSVLFGRLNCQLHSELYE